jgi:VanZ family protein
MRHEVRKRRVCVTRKFAFQLLFWTAAAFALAMAILPSPPNLHETKDKIQHMIAFGVLTLLAAVAYPRRPWGQLLVGLSLFGAFIELVQAIPAIHRDSDVKDWLVDTIAAGAAIAIVMLWRGRSHPKGRDRPAHLLRPEGTVHRQAAQSCGRTSRW